MLMAPSDRQIEAFRDFNRFYTRQIGVLEEGLLETPYTLTQARVLFELGTRGHATASEIGAVLSLDAGYLSRILQKFSADGLLARKKDDDDARRTQLSLTTKGRRIFHTLDKRSRNQASTLLTQLPDAKRKRLLTTLGDAREILSSEAAPQVHDVHIRPYQLGDLGWAIMRHAEIYGEEYGWNGEFETLVAKLFTRFAEQHDVEKEQFWVAELNGKRAGCVFLVCNDEDPSIAQLRCLLVEPEARGHGIGWQLVSECMDFARSAGFEKMMLWTNDVLVSARRIYEAAGFTLIKEEHHHSFGHDLTGQFWMMELK